MTKEKKTEIKTKDVRERRKKNNESFELCLDLGARKLTMLVCFVIFLKKNFTYSLFPINFSFVKQLLIVIGPFIHTTILTDIDSAFCPQKMIMIMICVAVSLVILISIVGAFLPSF